MSFAHLELEERRRAMRAAHPWMDMCDDVRGRNVRRAEVAFFEAKLAAEDFRWPDADMRAQNTHGQPDPGILDPATGKYPLHRNERRARGAAAGEAWWWHEDELKGLLRSRDAAPQEPYPPCPPGVNHLKDTFAPSGQFKGKVGWREHSALLYVNGIYHTGDADFVTDWPEGVAWYVEARKGSKFAIRFEFMHDPEVLAVFLAERRELLAQLLDEVTPICRDVANMVADFLLGRRERGARRGPQQRRTRFAELLPPPPAALFEEPECGGSCNSSSKVESEEAVEVVEAVEERKEMGSPARSVHGL